MILVSGFNCGSPASVTCVLRRSNHSRLVMPLRCFSPASPTCGLSWRLSGSSAKSAYGSHLPGWRCCMATLVMLRRLTAEERTELERLARSRTEEARLVVRAKIVLGLAAGERPYQVADRVGVGRMAAYEWLHRFNAEGLEGLTDHPAPAARRRTPPSSRPKSLRPR